MPELVPSERGARPSRRRRGSLGFAVDGYLAARVSRQTRRIGGRMGNAYRYASVYFVPLGFAKGWLKGSGGRPAARLFSFGNYPRAGMFRAVLPLRERAISEISTPVARGCQPRRCEPAWLAPSRGGRSACHVSSQGQSPSTCRLAARWFWHGPGVPDKAVVSRSSSGGLRKRAGLVNGGTQPGREVRRVRPPAGRAPFGCTSAEHRSSAARAEQRRTVAKLPVANTHDAHLVHPALRRTARVSTCRNPVVRSRRNSAGDNRRNPALHHAARRNRAAVTRVPRRNCT